MLLQPPAGRKAFDIIAFLDGHRHAVQRPPDLALGQSGVGRVRARAGALEVTHRDRVEITIVFFDPVQAVIQQLSAADLLVLDHAREFGSGFKRDVGHDEVSVDGVRRAFSSGTVQNRVIPMRIKPDETKKPTS